MTDKELNEVIGEASSPFSAAFLNAISRGVETIYNLGKAFGTALNMIIKGKSCS